MNNTQKCAIFSTDNLEFKALKGLMEHKNSYALDLVCQAIVLKTIGTQNEIVIMNCFYNLIAGKFIIEYIINTKQQLSS